MSKISFGGRTHFSLTETEVTLLIEALTTKIVVMSRTYDEVAEEHGHDSGAANHLETKLMEFDFLLQHIASEDDDQPSWGSEEQAEMQVQWGTA